MLRIGSSLFPVCNAAGHCKNIAEVERLARSAVSGIVVGSITVLPRDGNPGNTFNGDLVYGLNSLGLPNPGIEKIREIGPEMIRIAHAADKPILMSAAGFSPDEFAVLAKAAIDTGFDGVEINVGCPNVADGGKRKAIVSYHRTLMQRSLRAVFSRLGILAYRRLISVKVSPMDPERLQEIAELLVEWPIEVVVTMNAVPNCLDFKDDGTPVIDTPDKTGYAGGSGRQVLQQSLGQVKQWRERLPNAVMVWGVGGVQDALSIKKMRLAGAEVVQVGTAYFSHPDGAKFFGDLATEFINLNEHEGVTQ